MGEWKGMLAISKAGHDKDEIFYIIEETEEYVFLADGIHRTVDKAKKKKKKHIQVVKKRKEILTTNEEIKRMLKLYKKSRLEEACECQKQM